MNICLLIIEKIFSTIKWVSRHISLVYCPCLAGRAGSTRHSLVEPKLSARWRFLFINFSSIFCAKYWELVQFSYISTVEVSSWWSGEWRERIILEFVWWCVLYCRWYVAQLDRKWNLVTHSGQQAPAQPPAGPLSTCAPCLCLNLHILSDPTQYSSYTTVLYSHSTSSYSNQ